MAVSRRDVLQKGSAAAAGLALTAVIPAKEQSAPSQRSKMPTRSFGKTGRKVSILALGSAELPSGEATVKALNEMIDAGVNYFDTAPSYQGGNSEITIGQVLKTRREQVFLATKTLGRNADAAYREVHESLKRLQTGHIDLLQIHSINDMGTLDQVLSKGGGVEGLERAKKEGLIRHIGITGHTRPEVISKALDRYPFESILVALSALDASLNDFAAEVVPKAKKLGIGVVGMKALKGIERVDRSFDYARFMRYVWSLDVSTLTVGVRQLPEAAKNVAAALAFKPMSADEKAAFAKEMAPHANANNLWWKRQ
ncbi:MAG: aldo/keto reductase [Armatimonadetes bacterium]|nr:aldo/keto reductase [Armatimonadota bacterium]